MHLKPTLSALLSNAPSQPCVKDFANLCHRIALMYLRKKARSSRLNPADFGVSLEDLAWECIADLFQRNEQGVFVKLAGYFGAVAWENKSEDDLLGATRRLVFSHVNQALCRIYFETDPSLGKLIRNLKLAVKASSCFSLVQRESLAWICLAPENAAAAALPVMPPEFLEARLAASLRGEADVKQVLHLLAEIVDEQSLYRKSYPLTGLALIIRSAFTRLNCAVEENNGHDEFMPDEIEKMIHANVEAVKASMRPAYVEKRKVDGRTYEAYFGAIRDMLAAEYVQNDGCNRSYYDYLHQHLQPLTREEYQDRFRCHFEYLAKLTRQELLRQLKKEW
jgi:hypothetical protein